MADQKGTSFRSLAFTTCDKGFAGNLGPGDWVNKPSDRNIMYSTVDGGAIWSVVENIPEAPQGICGMQAIDENHVYGVGRYDAPAYFIRTVDGGDNWEVKNLEDFANGLVDIHFFDIDTGFITGRGNDGSASIWQTTDGGDNFIEVARTYSDHVWKIYFRDRMNGYANISNYDGSEKHYIYTTDGGLIWDEKGYTSDTRYEGLGIAFFDEQLGWCGGDNTTWETRDGGETFSEISIDPGYDDNINRFLRMSDSVIYAIGSRVYKYVDKTVGIATVPQVDNYICTITCSPNPITGSAQITYTLPEDGDVIVAITSIGGREIEVLVREKQKAGTYTIDYNPDYKLNFVTATIGSGRYRRSVHIVRED